MEDFHTTMNTGVPIFLMGCIVLATVTIVANVLWAAAGEISGNINTKERLRSLATIIGWIVFYVGAVVAVCVGVSYFLGLVSIKLGVN